MGARLRGPRARSLALILLIAATFGLALHRSDALSWLESKTVDARFTVRGRQAAPPNIVVVGVDNATVGRLPRYPFPRRLAARAIDQLHAAGARVIAYDVGFERPTDTADDASLFDAAGRARPVVFGTTLIEPSGATEVLGGDANLRMIGARAGAADLPVGGDGVLRRPLAELHHLPSFASAVLAALRRAPPSPAVVNHAYIDFRGPPGTVPIVPFWRVLAGQFDPRAVKGKVVVVGLTAPLLQDIHLTSAGGGLMSGPEIQAEAILTGLDGYPLRDAPAFESVLIILLLAALVPLVDALLGSLAAGLAALVTVIGWTVFTQLAFDRGSVVDFTSTASVLLISTGGVFAFEALADSRERRRLRGLFAAGAPDVVADVLNQAEDAAIGPAGIIAGYRLEEQIGKGGMGTVYRANQLALDRRVAVKVISKENSDDPDFRVRFKRESRLAAAIEHPNVVPVFDAGEDDGLLFITMRYVDGIDLGEHIRTNGPPTLEFAARVTAQIASALTAAHTSGLVHRDVKPANVLLTSDEHPHVYLTDFGIAKHLTSDTGLTETGALIGTVDYMAPEQIRGEAADHRADIYALTGLFYYSLTGETPYPRDHQAAKLWAHVSAPPPRPCTSRPDLPSQIDEIVATGLAKMPQDRYAQATDLAAAIVAAARLDVWSSTGEVIEDLTAVRQAPDVPAREAET